MFKKCKTSIFSLQSNNLQLKTYNDKYGLVVYYIWIIEFYEQHTI